MVKITDRHSEVLKRIWQWERIRLLSEGSDAVKEYDISTGGRTQTSFIFRLAGQDDASYWAYVQRAPFYNAIANTVKMYKGMLFGIPPQIVVPDGDTGIIDDYDYRGTTLQSFAAQVFDAVLKYGRAGILIDLPESPENLTRAEAEAYGVRPYATLYQPWQITNWEYSRVNGRVVLSRLVIQETEDRYKELVLSDGYSIIIWDKIPRSNNFEVTKVIRPLMNGEPLRFIPFVPVSVYGEDWQTARPPLLDLADMTISHYRTMADLEHGRFFLGVPTPVFAGFNIQDDIIRLGSTDGIVTSDPNAKWGFLELSGTGLQYLENAAKQKEQLMAELGASLLSTQFAGESGEALQLRGKVSTSILASIAKGVEEAISNSLWLCLSWYHGKEPDRSDVSFALSDDYLTTKMTPQELVALIQAVQSGQLPRYDFYRALVKGKIIAQDRSYEEYQEETTTPLGVLK